MREKQRQQNGGQKCIKQNVLTKRAGAVAEMSRTDFQPIWNSTGLPPSYSKPAPARPVEF